MSRECGIPEKLRNSIVSRWLNGHSTQRIADWVNETHGSGPHPVTTSRSSIVRLIELYSNEKRLPEDLAVVRRFRHDATSMMDDLDYAQAETKKCFEEADQVDASPGSAKRVSAKLRALSQMERFAMRRVKLAGFNARKYADLEEDASEDTEVEELDDQFFREYSQEMETPPEPSEGSPKKEGVVRMDARKSGETSGNDSDSPAPFVLPDQRAVDQFAANRADPEWRKRKSEEIGRLHDSALAVATARIQQIEAARGTGSAAGQRSQE